LYNVNTRGIHTPNVIVGMAIFTGGLLQFIAGMWEFPRGNVFGATGKLKDIKLYIFQSLFSCFLRKGIQEKYLKCHHRFKHFFLKSY
jgi:GPR1/FUN34/yaaH family